MVNLMQSLSELDEGDVLVEETETASAEEELEASEEDDELDATEAREKLNEVASEIGIFTSESPSGSFGVFP